jgi:tetratricopeptide (TPR) repeat protein
MHESPSIPSSVADYINDIERKLEGLIKRQFAGSTILVLIAVTLFFGLYASLVFVFRVPANGRLLQQLEDSNTQLSRLSEALQRSAAGTSTPTSPEILNTILTQADLHRQAIQDIRRTNQAIPAEGLSLIQLLGGSAILALLGYLGLQRLQNIDTEIQSLREFMFKQIKERVDEGRDVLKASVDAEVDKRFEKTRVETETITTGFRTYTEQSRSEFKQAAADATQGVAEVESRVKGLLEKYDWLSSEDVRNAANEVSQLTSVEQAHMTAAKLNHSGDTHSARLALRRIVEYNLLGSSDEFHNAHTEAMRMDDYPLGLAIVDAGLSYFPDQYDLMADKARVLISTGRADEARTLLEDWRGRKPLEFSRGWRPVVFYSDAILSGELTSGAIEKVETAFGDVTKRLPTQLKAWSAYAQFERDLGRLDKAEEILRESLTYNPFSQQLNYVLGELLLKQGRAQEALEFCGRALKYDNQDQFQHDVSQDAIKATLGQAYEAEGELDQAEVLYKSVLSSTDSARFHIRNYATSRLQAIAIQRGEVVTSTESNEESLSGMLQRLLTLKEMSAKGTDPAT